MLFSSAVFLFFFMPVCLSAYYLSRSSNLVLLLFSLLFYAWGEPILVTVMVGTIVVNFYIGRVIDTYRNSRRRQKLILATGISFNLILLGSFKYANFLISLLNSALAQLNTPSIAAVDIPLPLGISFFTFQSMSYLIDIYRDQTHAEKSILNFALFKTLFPQLIAGPIVRYVELTKQLTTHRIDLTLFTEGLERFIIGLAQKVLVADVLALTVDRIFALSAGDLSFVVSWVGVIAFTLQIYFDFSGYSNMAIGLSLMLGFRLPENFNFPYAARSIQDFWRRWHMTLSRWFRDYLYIPLGGNQRGAFRTGLNLFAVFLLCGLWHGANLTFMVWGLYHGLFLTLERTRFSEWLSRFPEIARHAYVLLVVAIGWAIFRAPTLGAAADMGYAMLGFNGFSNPQFSVLQYADSLTLLSALIAISFSFPQTASWLLAALSDHPTVGRQLGKAACIGFVFIVSLAFVGAQTHHAFIYFRF